MASNPVTHHEGLEVSTVVEREGGYRDQRSPYSHWSYQLKDVRITLRRDSRLPHLFDLGFTSNLESKAGPDLSICLEREQLEQLRDTIDCIFQLEREDASLVHGTRERRMLDLSHLGITPAGDTPPVALDRTAGTCPSCSGAGRFDDIECPRCSGKGEY